MATNQASVDADLYVLLSIEAEKLWSDLQINYSNRPRGFTARQEDVIRKPQSLPDQMSDWRYEHIYISPEAVSKRALPAEMRHDAVALVPDTLLWTPLRIASTRFKDFLETEFPDGSYFYPFSYRDADTKEVKQPDIWFWLPRNFLYFSPQEKRSHSKNMRPQVWGSLSGLDTTWEMHHNKVFQNFVADLPFWTASPRFAEITFRSDVYHRLKAEGFSGFVEADADNYLRHTPEQSVGFIHYDK